MADHEKKSAQVAHEPAAQPFAVGARLQAVRLAFGLSQRELARRANMTNSSLSLIEQGKVSPSIGSLERILDAVPMSLPEFFAETPQSPVVHPADNWMMIEEGAASMRVMRVQTGTDRVNYLVDCELPPGSKESSGPLLGASKGGLVAGMVLQGRLELRLDGVCHGLTPGDGFQFPALRRQLFANCSETLCRFVLSVQLAK